MVLTSLSLHVILLLIYLLVTYHWVRIAGSPTGTGDGPAILLSKEEPPASPPPPKASTPPPKPPQPVPQPSPTDKPSAQPAMTPERILAARGGPHLRGGVVIILDISGSMYEPYAGSTRLALARKFLARQIEGLADGTPFSIVLYGERTQRSGPLVAASTLTRGAAVHFIDEDFDCGGGTDLPIGLVDAVSLQPASLILVTDGDLNTTDDQLMSDAGSILGHPGPHLAIYGIAPRPKTDDGLLLHDLAHQQAGTYQPLDTVGK